MQFSVLIFFVFGSSTGSFWVERKKIFCCYQQTKHFFLTLFSGLSLRNMLRLVHVPRTYCICYIFIYQLIVSILFIGFRMRMLSLLIMQWLTRNSLSWGKTGILYLAFKYGEFIRCILSLNLQICWFLNYRAVSRR